MDYLKRKRLVLDNSGRDLIRIKDGATDLIWRWVTSDGQPVAEAGKLKGIGDGSYRFTATAPDLKPHDGDEGTEADLLARIGTARGWHMPENPV